jgi:hypothetical protein
MTRTDRALLAAAVLSGVLLADTRLRGGPDPGSPCGNACQPTQMYYDCLLDWGYYYEKGDCYPCANGLCANPPDGTFTCVQTDETRRTKNITDVSLYCPCDGVTRVQATGTFSDDDPWDENPYNMYWVCLWGISGGWGR